MITISQIYRPLGVTAKRVEFLAFQNNIKFDRKNNSAAKFTDEAAQKLIEIIKKQKEEDEYISISDVARRCGVLQASINSYIGTLKIQKHNRGFWAYITKQDAERVEEHQKKVMREKNDKSYETVTRREYYKMRYLMKKENGFDYRQHMIEKRRLGNEAVRLALQQAKEQRIRELTVDFRHKDGKIYTGIIIGGLDRVDQRTALIRYVDQGIVKIAEPLYPNVLNKSFDKVAELVKLAKSDRRE
jgi:hypothetical protein